MTGKDRIARLILIGALGIGMGRVSYSQGMVDGGLLARVDRQVEQSMKHGNIPGLSLVIIDGQQQIVRTYGSSDQDAGRPVTARTLFQIGSCSKAFTALVVAKLAARGLIDLNASVSAYIPWFKATYKGTPVDITLLQLLHHTSGIPWQTISSIPRGRDVHALEQTIQNISGIALRRLPGKRYEYATVNYDILAYIVQCVIHQPFETYLQKNILEALQLSDTRMGYPADSNLLAKGYKIGFLQAREYTAPVYAGNNASGYIISNANDMARWLRLQMGLTDNELYDVAGSTQLRDETVPLHGMSSYAMGWQISLSGNGEIYHDGLNPNYSSYIAFRPKKKLGVVVLANSNSSYTPVIGDRVMKMLAGEKIGREFDPGDGNDAAYSILSFVAGIFNLAIIATFFMIMLEVARGQREYKKLSRASVRKFLLSALGILPFLYGLYLLPVAMAGFTWDTMLVWSPQSLPILVILILTAMSAGVLTYLVSLFFPAEKEIKDVAPKVLLISILSGVANMVVIILVTSALDSGMRLRYLIFYYALAMSLYLLGRRFVQIRLIRFSRGLVYDLRVRLVDKLFSASYQQFERIDRGRIYTALNDDVETLGGSADQFIMLVTSAFTVAGSFLYLMSIAFWTAVLTIGLILIITTLYFLVSKNTRVYFEQARDTRNIFMRLVNGVIDGFKEISLRREKKIEYREDIAHTAGEYRDKISTAGIRFVNTFLVGDSLLILLLGIVAFAIPRLFPDIQSYIVMSFIIVLLYLIGPVNSILGAVPAVMQLKVAWHRLQAFLQDIPSNTVTDSTSALPEPRVKNLKAAGVRFTYKHSGEKERFSVGPIDLEINSGEILFLIGGNGSGKTTLAKLLTGLYTPDEGVFMINNKIVESSRLSEYFSVSFNPPFLFEKLYNIDTQKKSAEIAGYLKMLHLDGKVSVADNKYNTIDLSGGQRKRLALLQCYLEDAPIYLFDEWAADQDPGYRNFFYRTLLPEMKSLGKIVIAITHDDHYFDVADKILRMQQGELVDAGREVPAAAVSPLDI